MNQEKIGKFLAEERKKKEYTQKQLAALLNVSDKTISKWETGKSLPDIEMMEQLCATLDISINELLAGERISTEELELKAEKNIKALIKENEHNRKNNRYNLIVGLSVLILGFFTLITSLLGTDLTRVAWFIDFPSVFVFVCVLTALRFMTKSEIESKVVEKCIFPVGVMMTIMNVIVMLNSTSDFYMKNIAICILPLLYSAITYIIWQSLKKH